MGSLVKETLKRICCNYGWSYGVFWCCDQRNSMLLTLNDAYYAEQMGDVIDDMLLQVHVLGKGIIGAAAFTGKHRWIFSDAHSGRGEENSLVSGGKQHTSQADPEVEQQFTSGIKTILLIPVEPQGVLQFGSNQKMLESCEILDEIKQSFSEMEKVDGPEETENVPSSLISGNQDSGGLLAPIRSSRSPNCGSLKPMHVHNYDDLVGKACSSMSCTGAQVVLSSQSNTQSKQMFPESTSSLNNSLNFSPCNGAWSKETLAFNTFEQCLPSELTLDSTSTFLPNTNTYNSFQGVQNLLGDSAFNSLYNSGGLVDEVALQCSSGIFMDNRQSTALHATESELLESPTGLLALQEEFNPAELIDALTKTSLADDISQWFAPSPEQHGLATPPNDELIQAIRVASTSSDLRECGVFNDTPISHPASSLQSSLTSTFNSDGKKMSLNNPANEDNLFDCCGQDLGCCKRRASEEDIIMSVKNDASSTISNGISGISELDAGSMDGPRKGLFLELGIHGLFDEIAGNSSSVINSGCVDHLLGTKRRKTECYSVSHADLSLSCLQKCLNSVQPVWNMANKTNLGSREEFFPKSQVGLWIGDSYNVNAGNVFLTQSKRPEEPAKVTKKRAKPGESTRPRPKDRQQIQDRLGELRKIIPNTGKCSIDALLDRTVKYMLFLQNVTKHAVKLKEVDEPKLIGQENGVILKDNASVCGGATWAFEVVGQTMVCPIRVEDLSPPGQMLIEMLCEKRGLFLEIADIIRGFGLNILNGVIELQENKIWARFIVEANEHITRMGVFLSLVQLLQQTATNGADSNNQPTNSIDVDSPLFKNYQPPPVMQPIGLADTSR